MEALAELKTWKSSAEEELEAAVKTRHEFARLQAANHAAGQELRELRAQGAEVEQLQTQVSDLQEANRELKIQEQRLQRELNQLKADHTLTVEGDLAAARIRAGQAERELTDIIKTRMDHKVLNDDLNRQLVRERAEVAKAKEENDRLKQQWEAVAFRSRRRRGQRANSKRRSPGRR